MLTVILVISVVYIGLSLLFYFFQHLIFFRPETLHSTFSFSYPFPFEELNFEMEDGGYINGIYFEVPASQGVVYYLKGNSRSIKGWGKFAKDFLGNGYDFLLIDYRGFGKSHGKRTQTRLFNDAEYLYKWLAKKYPQDKIVVYGRSFGSGIAARVAAQNQPKLLILDSPYFSFYHNIKRYLFFVPLKWILRYDIRTDAYLKEVDCPVYILHGTKDRLFPINQSERLRELFPGKISLIKIEDGHHNDLPDFPEFHEALYEILYVDPKSEKNEFHGIG